MHETNVYRTILGGVSRGFRIPLVDSGARSLIFWHLKMGTFGESFGRVLSGFWKIEFLDRLRPIFPAKRPQKVIWPDEGLNFEINQK